MEETEICYYSDQLLQGDILKFSEDNDHYPFDFALIINADCDMENQKHDGVLALLPIYRFDKYLSNFWINKFINDKLKNSIQKIKEICSIDDAAIEELKRWVLIDSGVGKFDINKFIINFKLNEKNKAILKKEMEIFIFCFLSPESKKINALNFFAPSSDEVSRVSFLKKHLTAAQKNLGESDFFISEINGDYDIGYVVRMRRVFSIDFNCCFKNHSEFQSKGGSLKNSAYRLSRLTPYYKFKIAQIFAMQFSRIGLPNSSEDILDLSIDNLIEVIK